MKTMKKLVAVATLLGAATVAFVAGIKLLNLNRFLCAERRLL